MGHLPAFHDIKGRLCRALPRISQGARDQSAQAPHFWESVLDGAVAERVLAGDESAAEAMLRQMLADEDNTLNGEVYLAGAGPGDPDLLTFHALRLMQEVDVVVYDNLVAKAIVDMTRCDAQRIFVARQPPPSPSSSRVRRRTSTSSPACWRRCPGSPRARDRSRRP